MQRPDAAFSKMPDGFPHDKLIGAAIPVPLIRGSELVDGLPAQPQKNRSGDRLALLFRESYKAGVRFAQTLLLEVFEKSTGLRRQPVPSSGQSVQLHILPDALPLLGNPEGQAARGGFPKGSA